TLDREPTSEPYNMLASGDTSETEITNVVSMVCFATALMENLMRINRDAFQEFRLRVGIAVGPVIAGVVGASKPQYDIWGDTVNVASRLESGGILGRIQVTERVARILVADDAFPVECRGPIEVKGKGRMVTYLVCTPFDGAASATTPNVGRAGGGGGTGVQNSRRSKLSRQSQHVTHNTTGADDGSIDGRSLSLISDNDDSIEHNNGDHDNC
ncbi:Adenylate cyclase type 2, partial [Fragariocoptes setiger]